MEEQDSSENKAYQSTATSLDKVLEVAGAGKTEAPKENSHPGDSPIRIQSSVASGPRCGFSFCVCTEPSISRVFLVPLHLGAPASENQKNNVPSAREQLYCAGCSYNFLQEKELFTLEYRSRVSSALNRRNAQTERPHIASMFD